MGETRQAVAIITGGSQGIGAGLVAGYRRRGWAVVATAHRRRADRRPLTTPAPQGGARPGLRRRRGASGGNSLPGGDRERASLGADAGGAGRAGTPRVR